MKKYISVVYNLTQFGIYNIKNAIVNADMDSGISMKVSFNGGSTFQDVVELNKKFPVSSSNGKIQVKILFNDIDGRDIYKVKATGFFQNLEAGTTVNFTKKSNRETFNTNIGLNGKYTILLPRGVYRVWYKSSSGNIIDIMNDFNPEIRYNNYNGLNKENTIELFLRGVDWAKYTVFDTFSDPQKILNGDAIIDPDGDLSDGVTDRKVRYWAIGFE